MSAHTAEGDARPTPKGAVNRGSAPRRPLAAALVFGVLASVALGFALRALGRALLDAPDGLPSLATAALIPATAFPVLGNWFGFYMSFFRKPSRHSMSVFLTIGAAMTVVGIAISATKLPATASIIPGLLRLIPRPDHKRSV